MRLTLNDRCVSMPWDAIDSVIFDVGNVLLAFRPDALLRTVLPDHEADYPALRQRVFASPYWPMIDRGVIGTEEAILLMSSGRPALRPLIDRLMRCWNAHLTPIKEGIAALHACKERGKRCYVLTNYAAEPFDESCRRFPEVFSLFDDMVVSGRIGITKPDPRIYRHAVDACRLDPERTLFIDDSPINIEGAMDCGLQGLLYDRPGVLNDFFRLKEVAHETH